jgi:hypothetical protein
MTTYNVSVHRLSTDHEPVNLKVEADHQWNAQRAALDHVFGARYGWQPDSTGGGRGYLTLAAKADPCTVSIESGLIRIDIDEIDA